MYYYPGFQTLFMRSSGFGQVFIVSDPREKSFCLSGFGLRQRNLHRTQSLHAKKKPFATHVKVVFGLKCALLGTKRTQYLSGCCVLLRMFFFLVGGGGGVLTWPETPPLLGHHHEVHHFYKSAEPVLVDRTWLQLVNTSPPHLHRIALIRKQKNIFRKLTV